MATRRFASSEIALPLPCRCLCRRRVSQKLVKLLRHTVSRRADAAAEEGRVEKIYISSFQSLNFFFFFWHCHRIQNGIYNFFKRQMAAEQAVAAGLYKFRYSVEFICGITGCHRSLAGLGNLDTGGSSS